MNATLQSALNDQANHELFAAHSYRAMSLWCASNDFSGFAEFFNKQAEEELEHAEKFLDHMLDRGIAPKLTGMDAPKVEFANLVEIAEYAETLERRNSENINQCYDIALEIKDFACQPMLLKFIDEQVEEEAWAAKMITLTQRAECPGATYNLDRHIIKELAE